MNSRRTLLSLVTVIALSPSAVLAQLNRTIADAETEWYAALMAADGARLDALIADEFAYQHPSGRTYAKADFIREFTSKNVTVASIGAVRAATRDYGQTVIVYGDNPIAGMLAGQAYGGSIRFVNVWRQTDRGWRIVHRNSELLPQQ
jgi:ketosteroid isomerase-like protein